MKIFMITLAAAAFAVSSAASADAATKAEKKAIAQHERSCKAQAARKFSAVHFLKRREFVKQCMGEKA